MMTRRNATKLIGGGAVGLFLPMRASSSATTNEIPAVLMRAIPSSGEKLPVIGLGTWQTFDIDPASAQRKALDEVLSSFVKLGGKLVDSSPMYGRAEETIGDIAARLHLRDSLFLATKVWIRGKQAGIESMERSLVRLQTERIDLMQVHNLVDVETQLSTIKAWKNERRFRYIGVTHYEEGGHAAVENVLRRESVDFLQINYSIMEREAEQRLLPLARDRGVAVIVNRPFGGGDLFQRVHAKPLPDWAREFDCHSWAQFLLKWILGNTAVTCAIPATNDPRHLEDNMVAARGQIPDGKMRKRMVEFVSAS